MLKTNLLILFFVLLMTVSAIAADKPFGGEGEIGIMITSGNSDTESINGKLGITYETEHLINAAEVKGLYKSEKNEETGEYEASAQRHEGSIKTGYKFTEKDYAFIRGAYLNDRFSGYHYQNTVSAGYGRKLITGDRVNLTAELGPGYRYDKLRTGGSEEAAIFRVSGRFSLQLTETAAFSQDLSVETGEDKTVTQSISAINAQIVGALAMKFSYTVDRQSNVPADTEKTNTETALTLVYGF